MPYEIHVGKANKTYTIDFDKLPDASKTFIIDYGLRQKLNDKVASFDANRETDKAAEAVDKLVADLQDGVLSRRAGGDPLTPYRKAIVVAALVRKGASKTEANKAWKTAYAASPDAVRDSINKAAKAELDRVNALDIDVSL